MNKQTIQASVFAKKPYAKPQIEAYPMKPMSIICTSGTTPTATQNEEYETGDTTGWF